VAPGSDEPLNMRSQTRKPRTKATRASATICNHVYDVRWGAGADLFDATLPGFEARTGFDDLPDLPASGRAGVEFCSSSSSGRVIASNELTGASPQRGERPAAPCASGAGCGVGSSGGLATGVPESRLQAAVLPGTAAADAPNAPEVASNAKVSDGEADDAGAADQGGVTAGNPEGVTGFGEAAGRRGAVVGNRRASGAPPAGVAFSSSQGSTERTAPVVEGGRTTGVRSESTGVEGLRIDRRDRAAEPVSSSGSPDELDGSLDGAVRDEDCPEPAGPGRAGRSTGLDAEVPGRADPAAELDHDGRT